VHQPTLIENESVFIPRRPRAAGRRGCREPHRRRGPSATLATRAEEAADASPDDPDLPTPAGASQLPEGTATTRRLPHSGPTTRLRLAANTIAGAGEMPAYGFFTSGVSTVAVVTSAGFSAEQTSTDATALALAATDTASGYAEQTAWAVREIDPAAVASEAAEIAERTVNADELTPGSYRAVLGPYAIGELLQYFAFDTFSGLALLEERSYLSGKLGERHFDEKVSIADDALDPRGLPKSFDFQGVPKQRVPLIENGVLRGAVWGPWRARPAQAARSGQPDTLPPRRP